jgi:hypothetical protein
MSMPTPGPFIFCPLCDKRAEYVVENTQYPYYYEPLQLSCNHCFNGVVFEEGGLVRFRFSHPQARTVESIFDRGWNALLDGKQLCETPFPGWWQTEKNREWERGWKEALRVARERVK